MGWATALSREVFRRLHVELSLWYAGVFGLLLVALGLVMYGHMAATLVAGADDLNQRAVADIVHAITPERLEPGELAKEAAEVREVFDVVDVQVFDAAGRTLARIGTHDLPARGPARETIQRGTTSLRLLRHPLGPDLVVVGHDMRDRDASLAGLARDLLVLLPAGALATLVAGTLLARKAVRPVREALENQRRFIADASHELRTPVAVVLAQAEAGGPEALPAIQRHAERLAALVSDLLLLTRADAASLALARGTFFLDELAEEVVADLRPLAAERGVALRFEPRASDATVQADPERLRQLLLILLDNALGHTPAGGTVTVWVERFKLGVQDTGSGIAPADLPRIFERFYRGTSARPGAGLGLAIARAIADLHGARLTASSPPGQGAEFTLYLPPPA
jgi:signal transduction histidine kinase